MTGQVRAGANPLAGVTVRISAYHGACGAGSDVPLLPSPALAVTDAQGRFTSRFQPTQAVLAACLRVAYSAVLFSDTAGIALRVPPAEPDTVHIDLTGP